jgi:hypothetical protein
MIYLNNADQIVNAGILFPEGQPKSSFAYQEKFPARELPGRSTEFAVNPKVPSSVAGSRDECAN